MLFRIVLLFLFLCTFIVSRSQSSGIITVGGDITKFYPVTWKDGNFDQHKPTVLYLGRSNIHEGGLWKGSVMATIVYHVSNGGHESNFLDVKLGTSKNNSVYESFIAGWADATLQGEVNEIVLWMRGNTNYYYNANATVVPAVYDGGQHAYPYITAIGGKVFDIKSREEDYVMRNGNTFSESLNVLSDQSSYFKGNLGLGKRNPTEKLEVNGNIRAKEIKVETANWPDYVFEEDYRLTPLTEIEIFIKANKHLPDIPSAQKIAEEGLSVGEMNKLMMKKIEELTLYMIELSAANKQLKEEQTEMKKQINNQQQEIKKLRTNKRIIK
ncbi:Uncharacterised protein [Sphingobacterium spiritivorum]|uniref:Uncharacterized protein n=1 Tax=Sphingobacterium spiritivorum TaxID=258 RepID=A0A380BLM5_SPHSI|nr:hypothetical protein [Sphingobacterium spiritivorum]SUJ02438.1 Uncharacterised protein [Sphingobacterium spiritivorum]